MKKVVILGASGSIGTQTLAVMAAHPGDFLLTGFSVGSRVELIPSLLSKHPAVRWVYLLDPVLAARHAGTYPGISFYSGPRGLRRLIRNADFDLCVNALVGFIGLEPSLAVLRRNKVLCLANKEALVVGGHLINDLLKRRNGRLFPIDSEHVGLAKCLSKTKPEDVEQLIITASGGALRHVPFSRLKDATPEAALAHPNWQMGPRITIDCATMMNKGFEVIEACQLFHCGQDKVEIIMHDESLVHAAVRLKDGTYLVDQSRPDMRGPITWALYQGQTSFDIKHVRSLAELKDCHFHAFDPRRYPAVGLALAAFKEGGSKTAVLNAADEVAIDAFLKKKISYPDITRIIAEVLSRHAPIKRPSFRQLRIVDRITRSVTVLVAAK